MIEKHTQLIKSHTNIQPTNVVEIGSRDGKDAIFYKKEFNISDANVYTFEPNPSLIKFIKTNYPNINVIGKAVSINEGKKQFNCAIIDSLSDNKVQWGDYGLSSLGERDLYKTGYNNVKFEKIEVDVIKMSTFMKDNNISHIDICKVDVEGLTYEVLSSFEDRLKDVKSFHLEMEYQVCWENQKLAPFIKSFMIDNGFVMLFETEIGLQTDSVWINKLYIKK
jgi:FkbM family methyltransferase